ncbi:hypothetical protein SAMN04490239_0022 [Rhodococcus koreensis]|uniref:Uncharacterized protein n=1 Tax=Rhodococcus koreensis TaxID=99653 RepID=A0A1H4I5A2_9NOCA|nr:hypothetical protein SAMN04490239_0022 [Rhodococcus koreensis]
MTPQDTALAIRRLVDSPWACRSLAAGDEYALAGLKLTGEERKLLLREVDDSFEEMSKRLATACVDPTLRDRTNAGAFFDAAKYSLDGLCGAEADDFQAFLANMSTRR